MKRPILYALIPFCCGIFFCRAFTVNAAYLFTACAISAAASFLCSSRRTMSHVLLYLALFFLGASYCRNSETLARNDVAGLLSGTQDAVGVTLRGAVSDDPVTEDAFYGGRKISFLLKVSAVRQKDRWVAAEGLSSARVYTKKPLALEFGDEVVMSGVISRPDGLKNPGLFDYEKYLANKGIYSVFRVSDKGTPEIYRRGPANPVKKFAYRARGAIRSILERRLEGRDAAFMKAMLIGDRSGLDEKVNDDFIKTGTVHIISISGLHVGLIAAAALLMCSILRIPKKAGLIITIAFLTVYSYIAGSSPPIIRAVIMFLIFAVGYIAGREQDLLNSLALAAFCILLWNPGSLFDPSFQLSFISMASIFLFAPKLIGVFNAKRSAKDTVFRKAAVYVLSGVSVSVAAWIGTWPVIALYFNIASPVSVLANLIIIPASFISMITSMCLLCLHAVPGILPDIVAHALVRMDDALFAVNGLLAQIPFAYFRVPSPGMAATAAYYLLVLMWLIPAGNFVLGRLRLRKGYLIIAALLAMNIIAIKAYAEMGSGAMKITFLDVGKGDAAFIEFPGGGNMLVDAGSGGDGGRFDIGRNVVAPYVWNEGQRRIDAMVITHPHEDHLGGAIFILENFPVDAVIDNGYYYKGKLYDRYVRLIKDKGIRHIRARADDRIRLPGGAEMFILSPEGGGAPPDANAGSVVSKLVLDRESVLFTGDVTSDAMKKMAERYGCFLRSEIIKFPHHGGRLGDRIVADGFIGMVAPSVSVTSAGRAGGMGASRRENYLANAGVKEYNTSRDGAVVAYVWPGRYEVVAGQDN